MCGSCCKGLAKIILFICNVSYLMSGLVMLGFGIASLVEPDYVIRLLEEKMPVVSKVSDAVDMERMVTGGGVFLVVLGAIVVAAAGVGCYGACAENKTILIVYMAALGVFLLAEVALIIFAAVAPRKFKGTVRDKMLESLSEFKEDVTLLSDETMKLPTDKVSLGWTFLQFGGSCCGTYNYTDYRSRTYNVTVKGLTRSAVVPISCCLKKKDIDLRKSTNYDELTFVNLTSCLGGDKININEMGCHGVTYDLILKMRAIGIGYVSGVMVHQLLLVILAVILCRQNNKEVT